jgi:Protein of unknown function (DUF2628)
MTMTSMSWGRLAQSASPQVEESPQRTAMRAFIARGEAPYLRHYEKLCHRREQAAEAWPEGGLPFAFSWHWPAFVVTIPWMFYRKMYTGGIILVALPVFLDHLLPGSLFLGSGMLIAVLAGFCGKSWYLEHAARRLAKARRLYPSEAAQAAYLARASGVSLSAGVFGALVQIVTATVIVLGLLPPHHF